MQLNKATTANTQQYEQLHSLNVGLPTIPDLPGQSRNWPTVSHVPGKVDFDPELFHKNLAEPSYHKFTTRTRKPSCR